MSAVRLLLDRLSIATLADISESTSFALPLRTASTIAAYLK
jgi:hypothetical protein